MPFVTVVSLGASAATDFLSSSARSSSITREGNGKSTLTRIRAVCEDEIFRDTKFIRNNKCGFNHNNNINATGVVSGNCNNITSARRKSVSFVDLSSVGRLSIAPSESGYSTASTSSSSSSACSTIYQNGHERERDLTLWCEGPCPATGGNNNKDTNSTTISITNGHSISNGNNNIGVVNQGKATVFKSWIRNKFSLAKNGKYSFEGSLTCLGHFGIKTNKSLLVDCPPETEYSTSKYYRLDKTVNDYEENGDYHENLTEIEENNCNLFVRECLRTYSTPFLELSVVDANAFHADVVDSTSNQEAVPGKQNQVQHSVPSNKEEAQEENGSNCHANFSAISTKAPSWFWSSWNQGRGTQLDEAGIALEGRAVVIHKEENLGDRFVQIKWDDTEEKFFFIVWTLDVGRDYICKMDLSDVELVWHSEHRVTVDKDLVLQSEQRKGFLRDVYMICTELGCYDKASALAASKNIFRVEHLVQLFQRLSVELSSGDKKSDLKACGKPKAQAPTVFHMRLDCVEFRLKTEASTPVEPYYVLLSIFDVKNGRKISEDYHVLVDSQGQIVDNNKALFRVSEANDQIFAVVRVEKTLQAADSDAYLRGNPDGKTGSRISKSILGSPLFTSTQRYRMPLCWAARSLFRKVSGSSGETTEYSLDTESSFSPFYKHEKGDEELIKILAEIKKPEKVSKLTLVPGVLKVSVEAISSGQLVELSKNKVAASNSVIEFPYHSLENFNRFVHHLYVYPVQLNLNALGGKVRARNILCRVFLRAEDDIDASPLESNPVDGNIATYVLHHRTNPEWYTEIKLELPVALDPRLHLLFQFLHISCSFDKATKTKQVENVVGYAWIPLLNKFRFIGGEHVLPVASSLPSGYLQIQPLGLGKGCQNQIEDLEVATERSVKGGHLQLLQITSRSRKQRVVSQQYSGPDIAWLDKCTLTVKLNLVSTVWTKCGSLGAFFAHAEKFLQKGVHAAKFHCDDETTVKAIRALESMDLATHRDFYPTIVNQICTVATISKVVASACLKFLIFSFHAVIEANLEPIIEQYVKRRFLSSQQEQNGFDSSDTSLADVIVDAWIDLFETADGATIASSLEQSRHLFSMIVKSFAVQGYTYTNVEDSKLVKLIQLFTSEVVQRCQSDHALSLGANHSLIEFFTALLSIVDKRHIVFAALNAYLACFGPGDSYKVQDFKFALLVRLVEHPLFLELNSAIGDDEVTRLENIPWARRHFLVATVMKQSRSGLGEVSNVRSLALKPIMNGLITHEERSPRNPMWVPWLRVVCDNLHRISSLSLSSTNSSRCSSVSTVLSATSSTLIRTALSKNLSSDLHSTHNHCQREPQHPGLGGLTRGLDSTRSSTLSVTKLPNGVAPSFSQNSSMTNINSIGETRNGGPGSTGDRLSVDRMSITNCDYLEAISAIKTSNPAASIAPSTTSCGSGTETIVNENESNQGSGDGQSMGKDSSEIPDEESLVKVAPSGTSTEADKSNVVLRRYDKLNDVETSQLLISGLYLLKTFGPDGLRNFWIKSTIQERASLLQMIHLACAHFTNARKNSTITRKKVVGIVVPPTMPPSPRTSLLPNKKWSSLPSKTTEDIAEAEALLRHHETTQSDVASFWRNLSTEATFICIDTLANLCQACKGEVNEMRDVIRTTLDVAKASEDTRAMLGALENLYRIDELASIVFAKGNEDLSHLLFCELLNGFGMSYLINVCVAIVSKLFLFDGNRTTSQSLLALSSMALSPVFVHNFRKSLALLERSISVNERSSFVLSITEKLSFIDIQEFEANGVPKLRCSSSSSTNSFKSLSSSGSRAEKKFSKNSLPVRLSTILNSLFLLKTCNNQHRVAELYLKLANSYSYFAKARLRIDAFDSLKDEHITSKRFSEALMCELHAAARLARQCATSEVNEMYRKFIPGDGTVSIPMRVDHESPRACPNVIPCL